VLETSCFKSAADAFQAAARKTKTGHTRISDEGTQGRNRSKFAGWFFDDYLGSRPEAHLIWWRAPFVRREFSPDGYAVYWLESMSTGKPTRIGFFETRDEAVENAMPYV